MRTIHHSLRALAGAAAVLVLVTACNNESGTAPTTPLLSQAQAESLAITVVADIVGEIGTATMDASGSMAATAPFDASAPAGSTTATQCVPTESPTPTTTASPTRCGLITPAASSPVPSRSTPSRARLISSTRRN